MGPQKILLNIRLKLRIPFLEKEFQLIEETESEEEEDDYDDDDDDDVFEESNSESVSDSE